MNNQELGAYGESLAVNYLKKEQYEILDMNYRFGRNEVDIIAMYNGYIRFIEVKTRVTAEIGEPWRAVTPAKQKQIIKVANQYVISNSIDLEVKFDVVSIVTNSYRTNVELIQDAFIPM